jgi:hypothetical protein
VTVGAHRVEKPRAILWEWLVLGRDSPLRSFLAGAAERDGLGRGAFDFLPDLSFRSAGAADLRGGLGGEVQRVELRPLPRLSKEGRRALARIAGRSIALFSWLGVSDLHWENLVLGVAEQGRVIFAPLDVEMIFADLSLPTETKLLPDADPEYAALCRHAAGVRRLLPYLGKPVSVVDLLAMASAYRATLDFLERHGREVADVLSHVPGLRETPIRVCLRGTGDYVQGSGESLWPPLLHAETEQLARGDIPYFFRLYGQPGVRYYAEPTLTEARRLPLTGDVPHLDPLLQLSRGLRAPSRRKLREEGLLTLIGAFDHRAMAGRHQSEEMDITFKPRSLVVKMGTGEELHARRDMSAFVGSVYLRCACGEVRTVFVPPVTVCGGW